MAEGGFEEGTDLALGLATSGMLGGLIIGTILINRAVRSDKMTIAREQEVERDADYEVTHVQDHEEIPEEDRPDPATSPLTIVVGAIAVAIMLGRALQVVLIAIEALISDNAADETFIGDIPLGWLAPPLLWQDVVRAWHRRRPDHGAVDPHHHPRRTHPGAHRLDSAPSAHHHHRDMDAPLRPVGVCSQPPSTSAAPGDRWCRAGDI